MKTEPTSSRGMYTKPVLTQICIAGTAGSSGKILSIGPEIAFVSGPEAGPPTS